MARAISIASAVIGRRDAEKNENKTGAGYYHKIQREPLFNGFVRSLELFEGRETPEGIAKEAAATERLLVQENVDELLRKFVEAQGGLIDLSYQIDLANTEAFADIVVDEVTIAEQVPSLHLLWLERQIEYLNSVVASIPTLDPSIEWTWSEDRNCYVSAPNTSIRAEKITKALTLAPATDKHPAQTQLVAEDVPIGKYTNLRMSTAWPKNKKDELREKVAKLLAAVKDARERANQTQIDPTKKISTALVEYLGI